MQCVVSVLLIMDHSVLLQVRVCLIVHLGGLDHHVRTGGGWGHGGRERCQGWHRRFGRLNVPDIIVQFIRSVFSIENG